MLPGVKYIVNSICKKFRDTHYKHLQNLQVTCTELEAGILFCIGSGIRPELGPKLVAPDFIND